MCVFSKSFYYNHNEPELFPFEKKENGSFDMSKPCEAFWEMLETRIKELDQMEIQCDLILFHPYDRWGFSKMTKDEAMEYLSYAVDMLGHLDNIWWSLANEYDTVLDFPEDWWMDFAKLVKEKDKRGHLLSNHHLLILVAVVLALSVSDDSQDCLLSTHSLLPVS